MKLFTSSLTPWKLYALSCSPVAGDQTHLINMKPDISVRILAEIYIIQFLLHVRVSFYRTVFENEFGKGCSIEKTFK